MRAALEASGVLPRLLGLAQARLGALGAADVTLVLDGCARLGLAPPAAFLEGLSEQVSATASFAPHSCQMALTRPGPLKSRQSRSLKSW